MLNSAPSVIIIIIITRYRNARGVLFNTCKQNGERARRGCATIERNRANSFSREIFPTHDCPRARHVHQKSAFPSRPLL